MPSLLSTYMGRWWEMQRAEVLNSGMATFDVQAVCTLSEKLYAQDPVPFVQFPRPYRYTR